MNDPKRSRPAGPEDLADEDAAGPDAEDANDEGVDDGDDGTETDDVAREAAKDDADRREAAAALISPAMPPAGAGVMLEGDRRLDDKSETEKTLERGD